MSGLIKAILAGDTRLTGAFGALASKIAAKRSGQSGGGAVMPKQKPVAPRVDPRGVLPMNTMGNDKIANLANARIRRK